MKQTKEIKFLELIEKVQACRTCPRMNDSTRVLGLGCGPLDAKILFVGEAPGRLGADDTELPFHGDQAGQNFESLIEQVGLSRYQLFVTNAVLCNPKDPKGNNSTPKPDEIKNCSSFLESQIVLIDPQIVVTLGATALKACDLIKPHQLTLRDSVRTKHAWFGRMLIPMYHPGQRAMLHRSFANQLSDYQFLAETARKAGTAVRSKRDNSHIRNTEDLGKVVRRIVSSSPDGVSYFTLHKLLFLSEIQHLNSVSERIIDSYVIRQKDGPYYVDLHLKKIQKLVPEIKISKLDNKIRLHLKEQSQISLALTGSADEVPTSVSHSIDLVLQKYGRLSEAELKTRTYLTKPMRDILRREKKEKLNLFNTSIFPYPVRKNESKP